MTDDEDHRMNHCQKWNSTNRANQIDKFNFEEVHSSNFETLQEAANKILQLWNLQNGQNMMK